MESIGGVPLEEIFSAATEDIGNDFLLKPIIADPNLVKESEQFKNSDTNSELQAIEKKAQSAGEEAFEIYGCDLLTFADRAVALRLLAQAYLDLKEDIKPEEKLYFEAAVESMARSLFPNAYTYESKAPVKCSCTVDVNFLNFLTFNQFQYLQERSSQAIAPYSFPARITTSKNVLEYPIEMNNQTPFSLWIFTDRASRHRAEQFMQYLLYRLAKSEKKGNVQFRCCDREKVGQSFGQFIRLIGSNNLFGQGVYSNEDSLSAVISELGEIAEQNIASLKGQYTSVYDYNSEHDKKIPITVAAFCDVSRFPYSKEEDALKKIMSNAKESAINTIFLTDKEAPGFLGEINNLPKMLFENNQAYLVTGNSKLSVEISEIEISESDFSALEEKMNAVEKVDTDFMSYYDLKHMEFFERDATDGLKIPFAFDENKNLVDLEIGDTTPHALLSGSTGSGKSVTLHTIINQIMIHYHPADVEIWAIDYKAVEFGYYVNKRTPHISVIGQDNSDDFTYGLIDLIQAEYNRRKNLFVQTDCKDFKAYRKRCGKRSLSRILIIVDEFHNMTQAISKSVGNGDYKEKLENLLSEMRAMGMHFLFCSQTIAAGLNGLTEKGRNQIGCRLSMKHEDVTEIKETLSLSLSSGVDFESIKYLRQGELIYKKVSNEPGQSKYALIRLNVLYTEQYRGGIIDQVNAHIEKDYVPRDAIICKNSERYEMTEKPKHPISHFIETGKGISTEMLRIFPGAPTSLKDSFSFDLYQETANNVLLVGENDDLRESVVFTSILGALIDRQNEVIVSVLDTEDSDNQRLFNLIRKISCSRLHINYGYEAVMRCIQGLKKIKPHSNGRLLYIWYGLNKLNNLIYLHTQSEENEQNTNKEKDDIPAQIPEGMSPLDFLNNALASLDADFGNKTSVQGTNEELSYKDCQNIFKNFEEFGPENNQYGFVVFNTVKGLKKSKLINIDNYEFRIGLKMSTDDSYDLFGSTSFVSKADDKTAVVYSGSKTPKTIRPYLILSDEIIQQFNQQLEG